MRVVVDPNVLVAAAITDGVSARPLDHWLYRNPRNGDLAFGDTGARAKPIAVPYTGLVGPRVANFDTARGPTPLATHLAAALRPPTGLLSVSTIAQNKDGTSHDDGN